jgi:hypothetical protein
MATRYEVDEEGNATFHQSSVPLFEIVDVATKLFGGIENVTIRSWEGSGGSHITIARREPPPSQKNHRDRLWAVLSRR